MVSASGGCLVGLDTRAWSDRFMDRGWFLVLDRATWATVMDGQRFINKQIIDVNQCR